jgi:hypothetical protein
MAKDSTELMEAYLRNCASVTGRDLDSRRCSPVPVVRL